MSPPKEPASGSTSSPRITTQPQHSRKALLTAASILVTASPASSLPLSHYLTGGYLTSPPSRNYIAYTSAPILPSASRPLSVLPEIEPTPHSLKSSENYPGGTCGAADGGERNYDTPMSRMNTPLPLDVQSSFKAGGDIEVSVSLFGIDSGGHFEFHACPLSYPEMPTEECFKKYPLEFIRDVNYGAVKDEMYPERAYLPLAGAFDTMNIVVDERENPVGDHAPMMEFRYVLKLPKDDELISAYSEGGHQDNMVANSQSLAPESDESLAKQFSQGPGPSGNRFRLRRRTQSTYTPITGHDKTRGVTNLTKLGDLNPPSVNGLQQWYATQVDGGYTVSNVATVPISSIVTDGNGTTTITTLQGVTVLTGGAKVPASMTTTWGDAAIYGEGIDLSEVDRPPVITTDAPEVIPETSTTTTTKATITTVNPNGDSPVNNIVPDTPELQQQPVTVTASIPENSKPSNKSTKYVLLRWHYQTSRDCYPKGYDTYSWSSQWGNWTQPWAGQCQDVPSRQEHYWNCAEIQILGPPKPQGEISTNSEPAQQQNEAPQAMPDMILVGKNELAHLNVLANDTDPNGDELHLAGVEDAQHGYVALLDGKKDLIYAPDKDFEGLDSFEYTVCDSFGECDTAKIDVLVGSNSDLIFAKDDKAVTTGTNPVITDVTVNDVLQRAGQSIVTSSDPLLLTDVSGTKRGVCKITSDNKVKYTANEAFIATIGDQGQDRCKYTVCLGEKSEVCDEGWLSIKVLPDQADIAEEAESDSLVDVTVTIQENNVDSAESLHNDSAGGDIQALSSNIGSDGNGDVIALDDNVVTDSHDEPFKIDVLKNDEYSGSAYLTVVTDATSGKCSLTDDNQVLYTPTPGFEGWDRCQYTVCVEDDVCDEGRIKIHAVMLPQDKSFSSNIVTNTDKAAIETGKPLVIDVIENDVAIGSSQPLVVSDASPALHGSCSVTDDNKIMYISNAGFLGWDRCQYTVCMGKTCNVGQIGIKVLPEEDSPVANISPGQLKPNTEAVTNFSVSMAREDSVTVETGKTAYLDVLSNDIKPNGEEWSIESVTRPNFGNTQIVFGRVEYTPVDGFLGSDSFEYTICDESSHCDNASVLVTVIGDASSSAEESNKAITIVNIESTSSSELFAEDDEASLEASTTIEVDVMANDVLPVDGTVELSILSDAIHGACEVTPDNKIKYTAPGGFFGLDRCAYSVCVNGECDEARVEFTISVNVSKDINSDEDETSPSDNVDTVLVDESDTTQNEMTDSEYADDFGESALSNELKESSFGGITAMSESSNVDASFKRLHANDDSVVTSSNVPVLMDVTINDFDGKSNLEITHAGGSQHGQCTIEGSQVRYTPDKDFIGHDRCGYIVCKDSTCDEGIIRIKVVSELSAIKHDKTSSVSPVNIIGTARSSSAQLCSQAASNHELRRLRGRPTGVTLRFNNKNRYLEANAQSTCVGASLVTTVISPTQTITYTSTYHSKGDRSAPIRTRTIDLHSKFRSASKSNPQVQEAYVDTEVLLSCTEDATVIPSFPDQNFGSAQSMLVSSASSKSGRHDAFLKFDTSLVDASVCSDGIIDVTVRLYSLSNSAEGGTVITTPSSMMWTENDITWNNAPNSNGIVLDSLGPLKSKSFYDIDVSSAFKLGQPLSLHILPGSASNVSARYATKDHTDPSLHPMLRISCISRNEPTLDQ